MLGSSLALAMGLVFLAAVRLSGHPQAFGLVVFVGVLFVALACALHLGAMLDQLRAATGPRRLVLKVAAWLAIGAGTAWLIERAPGDEVLVALLVVPGAVAVAGVVVARSERWAAGAFLALAVLLAALLGPIWLERQDPLTATVSSAAAAGGYDAKTRIDTGGHGAGRRDAVAQGVRSANVTADVSAVCYSHRAMRANAGRVSTRPRVPLMRKREASCTPTTTSSLGCGLRSTRHMRGSATFSESRGTLGRVTRRPADRDTAG